MTFYKYDPLNSYWYGLNKPEVALNYFCHAFNLFIWNKMGRHLGRWKLKEKFMYALLHGNTQKERFWSRINCKKHHLCLLHYLSTWKDNIGNFLKFAIIHTDSFRMFYEYLPLVAVVAGFIILVRKVTHVYFNFKLCTLLWHTSSASRKAAWNGQWIWI